MERVLGLIVAGSGLAYFISGYAPAAEDHHTQAAEIARIVAQATVLEPETVPAEAPGLRKPVISPAAAAAIAPALPPRSATTARPANVLPDVTIKTGEQAPAAPVAAKSAPDAQRRLALAIQTELKRVGCYTGRIDGSWGDRSRSAMETFIERVNASLPTREPDVFLLSLIRGQNGNVCGQPCASGQVFFNGRCTAREVLADARPASPPADAPNRVAMARPQPLPGRMSIGGPVAVDRDATPVTGWPSPTAERLPWQSESASQPSEPAPALAALSPDEDVADTSDAADNSDSAESADTLATAPRKVTRTKKSWNAPKQRPPKRRYSTSKSVQMLFLHPLGRM
jgi:hypothetical protein